MKSALKYSHYLRYYTSTRATITNVRNYTYVYVRSVVSWSRIIYSGASFRYCALRVRPCRRWIHGPNERESLASSQITHEDRLCSHVVNVVRVCRRPAFEIETNSKKSINYVCLRRKEKWIKCRLMFIKTKKRRSNSGAIEFIAER